MTHYPNNFLTVDPPSSDACQQNLDILTHLCDDLGMPLALGKVEGPSIHHNFLPGNTFGYYKHGDQTLCRSAGVNQRHLTHLAGKKKADILSLVGLLQHVTQVKIYIIKLKNNYTFTRLNREFCSVAHFCSGVKWIKHIMGLWCFLRPMMVSMAIASTIN